MFTKEEFIERVFKKYDKNTARTVEVVKNKDSRKIYSNKVKYLTGQVNKSLIEGFEADKLLTKKMIKEFGLPVLKHSEMLVIDHKISIAYGYKNNIPCEHIAHVSNLRFIPSNLNMIKRIKCHIDQLNQWIIENL
jgi:hypothetical protein